MVRDTKVSSAGFTLIETVVVLAIGGMLFAIAFAGQSKVRAQAGFDAGVNKLVSSIADARNEAVAGVNIDGSGDGSDNTGCTGVLLKTVFAGTAWTTDGAGTRLQYFKTDQASTANTCVFQTQPFRPDWQGITPSTGTSILFVRTATGGLVTCQMASTGDPRTSFLNGACDGAAGATQVGTTAATTPYKLFFADGTGFQSEIDVDGSGLARRVN